jgi:molybdopterin-containing oxidoreductase family iron-sulfur binding subunit
MTVTRREMMTAGAFAGAALGSGVIATTMAAATPSAVPPGGPLPSGGGDSARMVGDLERALAKRPEDRRWEMVIDTRRCIGCSACTVACIAENNLPPAVTYRTVPEATAGKFPNLKRIFMPTNCAQCEQAPCIAAANAVIPGSMSRRPDGIVAVDYTRMKGRPVFEAAQKACPYKHALYYDAGGYHTDGTPQRQAYESRPVMEYGQFWKRAQTQGTTRKCHFCADRIDVGLLPACVSTCPGLAMHFGDVSDPKSLVAELLAKGPARRFAPEEGPSPGPRIHYIDDFAAEGAPPVKPDNRSNSNCSNCHEFTA